MLANSKRWVIAPRAPDEYLHTLKQRGVHYVLAQVLYNRGYTDPQAAEAFLNQSSYSEDDNPFLLKGMVEAVYRLRMAIRREEPVAVYGDFDADGVTSTVLLTDALKKLGATVRPYIPDRVDEGYGLNSEALKRLAESGVRVVVTVDCGIRSIQEVEDGTSHGLEIIITDHHSIGKEIPPALTIINPKQPDCPYPEKMLAGVGLAHKLVQALYMEAQRRVPKLVEDWHPDDYLDLVALGTVADVSPLRGENRPLVYRGLKRLNDPQRVGLQALYNVARVQAGGVTSTTIGFILGPRINAAGRLESALLAYNLLTAEDERQAWMLAEKLETLNRDRQAKTREMQTWAEESLPGDPEDEPLLFAADTRFLQGVVGLVASRLTEVYYRPSVVIQRGEEESHGSCRSIPEFHITDALDQCADLLERYGGHAAAAGFTVLNKNIEPLGERLYEIALDELSAYDDLRPTLDIDVMLPFKALDDELADALAQLEPTGEANSIPLFASRGLVVKAHQTVGSEEAHLKLRLADGEHTREAIAFRRGALQDALPERVDVAYHLETDEWNGRRRLQLNVQDIRPAEDS